MHRLEEAREKIAHARGCLLTPSWRGIVITDQPNFAYYTAGGRGFLGLASVKACGLLLITEDGQYLLANSIEGPRLMDEELPDGLCELVTLPWAEDGGLMAKAASLAGGEVLTDADRPEWFAEARRTLCPAQEDRYAALCAESAAALEQVLRWLDKGVTEAAVAGAISSALWARGMEPISLFVAADDRSEQVRHYVPTQKAAQRRVIASICARRGGLVASVTRTVYFEAPTAQERQAYERLLRVEAAGLDALTPGATGGQVFARLIEAYGAQGMPGEWQRHHQGGLTGYLPRELRFDEGTQHSIAPHQAYALNPSCPGAKLEDTVLLAPDGVQVLSTCGQWPTTSVQGRARPDLLVLE